MASRLQAEVSPLVESVRLEHCFYIDSERPLRPAELKVVEWLLAETFEPEAFSRKSQLEGTVLEVGPRVEITTPWSTNAVKICRSCGLHSISRIERSRRYEVRLKPGARLSGAQVRRIYPLLYDRMTESLYLEPLTTFDSDKKPEPVKLVPLLEEGISPLERLGYTFDRQVMEHNCRYFTEVLHADPTDVVLAHLDQSQSDHSRHRRFNAAWRIDGVQKKQTLMDMIKANHLAHPGHTLVSFGDNASVIRGHHVPALVSSAPAAPSKLVIREIDMEETAKGESHNHPTAIVSPAGAGTGTGGRIRDNQTVGRGGTPVAGSTLYLVGNLHMPGYSLPWETKNWEHPYQLETPLQIILGAPRGAYRYGNEFGEPTVSGSTTSFEHVHGNGKEAELFGYTKCGMWTVGLGWIDRRHLKKLKPEAGLQIVQLGGDAYPIGLGGAAGSSRALGSQEAELDWNSVQRANAEMEKVFDRVVQACIMMGSKNPVWTIHDLGAGGDANAVSELVSPAGGRVYLRRIPCGDRTMSVLEYWCNESQERVVLLTTAERLPVLQKVARREKCPLAVVGEVTGDGKLVLVDEAVPPDAPIFVKEPVNLDLGFALGKIPQMVLEDKTVQRRLSPLRLPEGLTATDALERVLRLLKVSSKGFLVNHVDRSVTGLIAQQQCTGRLQLPVADVAVTADSYFTTTGRCWGIGDQAVKWIVSPEASVRLAAGEALTNLVWAPVEEFEGISLLGNWGVAASEPGEGARLYQANEALNGLLDRLGISVNGGKDSMSMAAKVVREGAGEMVKAPGTLVVTAYAACPDITKTVTPDIKQPGKSELLLIDLSGGKCRTGGSALSQVYNQVGDEAPDVDDPRLLRQGFEAVQKLIRQGLVLAGHDRSDGGLIVCLLEMAFAGNCGLKIGIAGPKAGPTALQYLFAEEPGLVMEYLPENKHTIMALLQEHGLAGCSHVLGHASTRKDITVRYGGQLVLSEDMRHLRDIWQGTSFQLERLQSNSKCAEAERRANYDRSGLSFHFTFTPEPTPEAKIKARKKPRVAILREEGTNGDREMAAAFYLAGFEPWDVTMTDLAEGRISLEGFRGVAFCGGFSYADVMDAGKGWAGVVRFNTRVRGEFEAFYNRPDTFSLGVCNGCQVMALLGRIPWQGIGMERQPRFVLNESAMFESRFAAVNVMPGPSIMLRGMEGSVLGVWVSHGEGRFLCPDGSILSEVERQGLAPIRFVDDERKVSEAYPFNPNGSISGIAALCSPDGRHLAMMPHPERAFLAWQWPYWPEEQSKAGPSPWLRLFQNAREWCERKG
ncbi:MAG: phosphoribosylformylglycinamidine synthase [Chloroflexi bacterium]|nr:phosphoribosylformylglycinamidine synthase [Chloroflexota bacterium]